MERNLERGTSWYYITLINPSTPRVPPPPADFHKSGLFPHQTQSCGRLATTYTSYPRCASEFAWLGPGEVVESLPYPLLKEPPVSEQTACRQTSARLCRK